MKRTKTKILSVFLSFCMIISCMVGMSVTASADATPEVTLDFTGQSNWNIPDSGNSNKNLAEFTDGTHTIKLFANTNYKLNPGYLLLGKTDSYLELPAFDFDVEKIVVTGASTASTSVRFNIFVGGTAVSTEATGSKSTNTFEINSAYQSAGNVYKLIVLSSHNIQISKIEIYKKASTPATQQWTNGNVTATLDGTKLTVEKTENATNGNMGTSWTKVGSAAAWSSIRGTITEVEIKDGVTSIGNSAFLYCSKLASVTIPSSVTSIDISSFFGCSALTSVTIPSSVTSIGNAAFYYCTALTSVTIPNSVTSIGENTFNGCSNLTSVTFIPGTADATLSIGVAAFNSTKSGATVAYGTGNTVLYDNDTPITTETLLTAIENKTLTWKAASSTPATKPLAVGTTYNIGDSIVVSADGTVIVVDDNGNLIGSLDAGSYAVPQPIYDHDFLQWLVMTSDMTLWLGYGTTDGSETVTGIKCVSGNGTNENPYKFELVTGSSTPTPPTATVSPEGAGTASVDEDPANSDNWLFTATPNEGYKFKWWALDHSNAPTGKYLKNTTSIVKTNFTESAGNNMITGITAVFEEDSTPSTPSWTNGNVTATLSGTKLTVEKTAGAADGTMGTSWTKVGSAPTWSTIKETITEVEIKDGVTSIGANAFNGCSNLTSVTFPSGLTSIGDAAFANCSALTSVTFPSSLNSIGQRAFHVCTVLASVTFTPGQEGGGLTIGDSAFDDIPSTTKVTYGTGNTVLYDDTTEITTDTLLTAIQRKSLTWKAASSTPATTTGGFVKVTAESQITEDNIAETTTADAKAWIIANLDALKSEQGTWYDFFWKENGTLKVIVLNYIALDETHVNEETVYDPEIDDVSRFFNKNENVYFWGGSSTPATTDVSFVRAASADELGTNLPNIPTYTKEQAETWIAANKATLAPAYAAHRQANGDALFVVVYAISEHMYSVLESGKSDLSNFEVNYYSLDNLKRNFTEYYDMLYYPEVTAATHTHTWGYNASGATITANCTGTGTCDITEGLTMTISAPTALTYDGTAKEASLSTGYNTTAFPGTYSIEYYNGTTKLGSAPVNAGTYTAKVTAGTGDGAATASVDFTITPKTVSSPTITLSPESFTYDGSAHQPTVTVKDGTTEISGDEYTVTYSNNTNAGTATVTITDKTGGNYAVSGEKTFTISPKEVNNPTITLLPESFTYDGTAKQPTVTVKDGTTVIPASEYNVEYSSNTNAGTATVTITDKTGGNYTVSGTKTFTIAPASQSAPAVSSTNETIAGKADGTITGVTTAMEYKLSTATEYTPITGTSVTGLAAGTYNVRYAADANHEASPAADVVINVGSKITVTFDADGGTPAPASQQFNYNQTVSKPAADPTKTGYTFKFWSADGAAEYDFNTPLTANITLTAVYQVNSYTITFDTDGGSTIASITQDYNTVVTAPADPTKTGYTFAGWEPAIPETMPAENVTVKAAWTINPYTITFVSFGKTVEEYELDYGTNVPVPATPSVEGLRFAGWRPSIPATMPAEDLVITALWSDDATRSNARPEGTSGGSSAPTFSDVSGSDETKINQTTQKMWAQLNDDNSVTVGWDKISGASKYVLYYEKDGKDVKVTETAKTKITMKTAKNGFTYKFRLKYITSGQTLDAPTGYTANLKVYYKPIVKLTQKDGKVTAKWAKVTGAEYYRVYKVVNGKLKFVTETTKTSVRFKATKGKTVTYTVSAVVDGTETKLTKSDRKSIISE